jgi:DNA uptake protein ComE-like DNA-binding protein
LVRNGLARIYGFKAAPPEFGTVRVEMDKLQQLENQARLEKIGAWGINSGLLTMPVPPPFVSPPKPNMPGAPGTTPKANAPHSKSKTPLGKIDINTATEKELTTVPGIGYVMAARIIAARPFRSADDLRRVSGIGNKKYAQIRPYFQ